MNENERFEHDKDERERDAAREYRRKGRKGGHYGFWTILGVIFTILLIFITLARCDIFGSKRIDNDGDGILDADPNEIHMGINHSSPAEDMTKGDLGIEGEWSGSILPLSMPMRVSPTKSIQPIAGSYLNNVINYGKQFLGTPYEYGSSRKDAKTFDCSDFTRWAFLGSIGMDLPKDSRSQARYVTTYFKGLTYTDITKAKRGDLLFFGSYRGYTKAAYAGIDRTNQTITHVGIYLGDGRMLHTASAPKGVRIDNNIFNSHYAYRFVVGSPVL